MKCSVCDSQITYWDCACGHRYEQPDPPLNCSDCGTNWHVVWCSNCWNLFRDDLGIEPDASSGHATSRGYRLALEFNQTAFFTEFSFLRFGGEWRPTYLADFANMLVVAPKNARELPGFIENRLISRVTGLADLVLPHVLQRLKEGRIELTA